MTDANAKARDAIDRVIDVCETLESLTRMPPEEFLIDTRSQWAVEMGLIRIGEGVNRIPESVLQRFPAQPWRQIVGMRNFAAHQYDDLNPGPVWRTATVDVPALRRYLVEVVIDEL
ncbi:MAG: HepT-like ribonuclease domain-containing protein [Gulosibacter sp.]|uniref:HepT-like ribonuclease domain-containing protein n=1 Tax=Gulosibacter sp. TaxID=2817531 RepID=UPI003F913B47